MPVATIALTLVTWLAVRAPDEPLRAGWPVLALIAGALVLLSLTRSVDALCCLGPTPPPGLVPVGASLVIIALIAAAVIGLKPGNRWLLATLIGLLLGLLVVVKTDALAGWASGLLRSLEGQSASEASPLDIRWLGISYIAFRLIHTLRDRQLGRLPKLSLAEYVSYVIFFPTLTAGPIDRAERFVKDFDKPGVTSAPVALEAGRRIAVGLFKKFVLADSLALFALSAANAGQTSSTGWLWLMVYGYAFRIYFDFAGYSDIAIGLGRLAGFSIPENFDRPYLKTTLTAFWNSWHITLATWIRSYYFFPVSRALQTRLPRAPIPLLIAFCQITTMILIGLWHGVTLNFAIWGLWHGVGLFIHNRYAAATRFQAKSLATRPWLRRAVDAVCVLAVFHYVALGWVWFALPGVDQSWRVLMGLFGIHL